MRDEAQADILLRQEREGVVRLTLNRPGQLNALSQELLAALLDAFAALAEDRSVRAVVIAGAGRAFCAGHDLAEMRRNADLAAHRALFDRCSAVMLAIARLPVPVIARVHGVAAAAGCQLVAACDMAFAADTARFATSGVKLGLFCSTPAVALSRAILPKRAFDMLVTGEFIDAATAADWGLVNESVAGDALDGVIEGRLRSILEKSPAAIRLGKQSFNSQRDMGLAAAYEAAAGTMACNMMEADAQRGIDAFLNRRKPA